MEKETLLTHDSKIYCQVRKIEKEKGKTQKKNDIYFYTAKCLFWGILSLLTRYYVSEGCLAPHRD